MNDLAYHFSKWAFIFAVVCLFALMVVGMVQFFAHLTFC